MPDLPFPPERPQPSMEKLLESSDYRKFEFEYLAHNDAYVASVLKRILVVEERRRLRRIPKEEQLMILVIMLSADKRALEDALEQAKYKSTMAMSMRPIEEHPQYAELVKKYSTKND